MAVDPDEEHPWAMQVVARAEKTSPPTHGAVCEAAAMAVVRLLTDPRATEGEWYECVRRWETARIRKVTRRARGARWQAVQDLPGVTAEHDGAQVRAFVPGPMDEVPPELSRLQVAGLDLTGDRPADDRPADDGAAGDGAAGPRPAPDRPYAVIALNPAVTMTTGKAAAQSAHAAHLLLRGLGRASLEEWISAGLEVRLAEGGVPWDDCVRRSAVAVRDAGFTEVPPGTMTAVAWFLPSGPPLPHGTGGRGEGLPSRG